MGINNGWFDAKMQYRAYIDYSANNSYNQILSPSQYSEYMNTFDSDCAPAVEDCYSANSDDACSKAQDMCTDDIENAIISEADFDPYDVRQPENDPFPPGQYTSYLANQTVQDAIGAQSKFQECPSEPFQKFSSTGDSKYIPTQPYLLDKDPGSISVLTFRSFFSPLCPDTRSFLATLSDVVQSGVQVLLWAGDADWICNHMGVAAVADSVDFDGHDDFQGKELQPYTVNGKETGRYKTVGNFTYLQVYAAGHEVPYYRTHFPFKD